MKKPRKFLTYAEQQQKAKKQGFATPHYAKLMHDMLTFLRRYRIPCFYDLSFICKGCQLEITIPSDVLQHLSACQKLLPKIESYVNKLKS